MSIDRIDFLDGARIIEYLAIGDNHVRTGNCRHFIAGEEGTDVNNLAICQYEGTTEYYLFYCDENWNVPNDSFHETLENAKEQAEFEFHGTLNDWRKKNGSQQSL